MFTPGFWKGHSEDIQRIVKQTRQFAETDKEAASIKNVKFQSIRRNVSTKYVLPNGRGTGIEICLAVVFLQGIARVLPFIKNCSFVYFLTIFSGKIMVSRTVP